MNENRRTIILAATVGTTVLVLIIIMMIITAKKAKAPETPAPRAVATSNAAPADEYPAAQQHYGVTITGMEITDRELADPISRGEGDLKKLDSAKPDPGSSWAYITFRLTNNSDTAISGGYDWTVVTDNQGRVYQMSDSFTGYTPEVGPQMTKTATLVFDVPESVDLASMTLSIYPVGQNDSVDAVTAKIPSGYPVRNR